MTNFLEQAFGKADVTSPRMKAAIREWMDLYFGAPRSGEDGSGRLAALIVAKLGRTVFAEYESRLADGAGDGDRQCRDALDAAAKTAMQYALLGGECLLKPVLEDGRFDFVAIRRDCYVPLGRDRHGKLTGVGTMELLNHDGKKYVLLERRTAETTGLCIENRLFECAGAALGRRVPLETVPDCMALPDEVYLPGVRGVGLAALRMPMANCVDGSAEGVSIFAPAVGLLHALGRCEDQLNREFLNGASRVFASEDLLRPNAASQRALRDDLFVGLPDDPANVGVTVYSPTLREGSYLARKQDILRSCESLLGLRRGILSETQAEAQPRTATEVAATSVDYDLTIRSLQRAWEQCAAEVLGICRQLALRCGVHNFNGVPLYIDWGDGVLYDRDRVWSEQCAMVEAGILRPEMALAWYFDLPRETEEDLANVRLKFMPKKADTKGGEKK